MGSAQRRTRGLTTASLSRRIEQWRRAGRPGKRIPEDLWDAAVSLARERGAWRVAGDLGLNYQTLKDRLSRQDPGSGAKDHPGFVEIDVGSLVSKGSDGETQIEVEREDGWRLKIRVAGGQGVNVEGVMAAFCRGES